MADEYGYGAPTDNGVGHPTDVDGKFLSLSEALFVILALQSLLLTANLDDQGSVQALSGIYIPFQSPRSSTSLFL